MSVFTTAKAIVDDARANPDKFAVALDQGATVFASIATIYKLLASPDPKDQAQVDATLAEWADVLATKRATAALKDLNDKGESFAAEAAQVLGVIQRGAVLAVDLLPILTPFL